MSEFRHIKMKLRYISLFSGIEAATVAWSQLGWECVAVAEIEKFPCAVLKHHYPNVPNLGDINDIRPFGSLDESVRKWYCNPQTTEENTMAGQLKKLTPEQAQECVKMYSSGMSLAPIATYFNVSRQAMWDLLRRRTKIRPQKRNGAENHFSRGGKASDGHAQNVLEYAIRKGIVERKTSCENCGATGKMKDGRTKIQAHHTDYNKPLEVTWLCQKCHHEWHKQNTPKRKEVLSELPDNIDIVVGGFP